MAKFYKTICIIFLLSAIISSIYLCSTIAPTYTSYEMQTNETRSNSTILKKLPPTGFNTMLFILCLIISIFVFSAAWCFGDIAQAAKKYLKTNNAIAEAAERYIKTNCEQQSENEESTMHMLKTFRN